MTRPAITLDATYGTADKFYGQSAERPHDPTPLLRLGILALAHEPDGQTGLNYLEHARLLPRFSDQHAQQVLGIGAMYLIKAGHTSAATTALRWAQGLSPGQERPVLSAAHKELAIATGTYR